MIKISKQLNRYFILVSLVSVLFITFISNVSINYFFKNYIQQSRQREDLELVGYIEQVLEDYPAATMESYMNIVHYAHGMGVEVRIKDNKGQVVLDSEGMGGMRRGMGMGHRRGRHDGTEDFEYREYPLSYQGQGMGTIEIGREASILATSEDQSFVFIINGVYIVSFLFSLLLSILASRYVSNKFLKPILVVKENASLISRGKYGGLKQVDTNTFELHDLSTVVYELAQKLDQQEILRRRLTSDIAHELRTPLATIRSHVEAFIDGVWEPTPDRLSNCYDEIIRLTKLINDLSDLSHIESDQIKLDIKKVNLSQLLDNIVENFEPILINKSIDLVKDIKPDVMMEGDQDRLSQIFVNLISNAAKYTNRGGNIAITLRESLDRVVVSIKDTGIGIKKEDLPFIFERFYRGDVSRSRKTGGTGIGLTIAKGLVEAHRGTITVDSQVGLGTEFIVEFPKS